jgi:hypothetical protein
MPSTLLGYGFDILGRVFGFGRCYHAGEPITLTTSLLTTPAIDIENFAGIGVHIVGTIATLDVYVSYDPVGSYTRLQKDGADVQVAVAVNKAVTLPPEIYPYSAMKLVANASGQVYISRKS